MVTTFDKALVAVIMGVLGLVNYFTGWTADWANEETVLAIAAAITPFVVWLVPNRQ